MRNEGNSQKITLIVEINLELILSFFTDKKYNQTVMTHYGPFGFNMYVPYSEFWPILGLVSANLL